MLSVISCVAVAHELRFVALAVLVCVLGCLLSLNLFTRLRHSAGSRSFLWLFLVALVGGSTIWTTHFSAMLGYIVPFGRTFDPGLTLASLATAIATSGIGFFIASLRSSIAFPPIGGAVFGLGVAVMHYTGMRSFLVPGVIQWDTAFVIWSVLLGAGFGAAALLLATISSGKSAVIQGASVLILCIASMHFTGMAAIDVVPLKGISIPTQTISDDIMLAGVVSITLVIIASVGSAFLIDTRRLEEATSTYEHLALHDTLTGMPNRLFLGRSLEPALAARGDGEQVAVFTIDLDRFKDVNDVHGHRAGDAVLRELALRIKSSLEENEFVARVGGDEFVAWKSGVHDRQQVEAFAARIRQVISRPFHWNHQVVLIGGSIGVALAPDDAASADDLIARADLAAYKAKGSGGAKLEFYSEGLEELSRARASMAIDLKSAIRNGELEIYFQPQNDTKTRKLRGFEALLRWHHPERGLVSPADFIPIAEETGLVLDIGRWVLEKSCEIAARWPDDISVAVNVSAKQVAQQTLPLEVSQVLAKTGLAPGRLEIELTESGLILDQTHALHVVTALKALGVSVAMDDFGTGYSSLSTLQTFPFDKIKIDREFISSLTGNVQSAAIVKSTILLGSSLSIPVLAEGVETEEQLSFLADEGCSSVQGYLFGRPVPLSDCEAMIAQEYPGSMTTTQTLRKAAG